MAQIKQTEVRNRLLKAMSAADFALLAPNLTMVVRNKGEVIIRPHQPIQEIDFVETGIASIVAMTEDERRIEVGLYGFEGMSGTAVILGAEQTPFENFYQVAGGSLRISSNNIQAATAQSSSLHHLLLRYVQSVQVQTAETAMSNGIYTLTERLSRWLLMCHDRSEGDELPLTHEFLAIMLAVRRSGVTLALQTLEGAQVIKARRGVVTIQDRAKLTEMAGGSYGLAEAEYERLVGPRRDP